MYVNNIPISHYDGELQSGYSVTGAALDVSYSKTGQFPVLLQQKFGLKNLAIRITFQGSDSQEAYRKYSLFCSSLVGMLELLLPDNAMYTAVMVGVSSENYIVDGFMEAEFSFIGVKHGPKQTTAGNTVFCESTLPKTDCILTVTVGKTGTNYKLGSVTFAAVAAGEVLCVDGITKRILVNGVPAAQRAEWLEFPYLKPGLNTIECPDTVTVEFYPAYF